MGFPQTRLRRLRLLPQIRDLVAETTVSVSDLIYPVFVCPGKNIKKEISAMPGCFQLSIDILLKECEEITKLKIPGIILFGIPEKKDSVGSEAYAEKGIIQSALKEVKKNFPELIVITDVCLCEYTDHGHCGVIKNNQVDNDETLKLLAKQALSQAQAGSDMVAPSDMMDGRIKLIRETLDRNGFSNLPILSYAAKYASAFYGPFREAAQSTPQFGDRKSYQMNPANWQEALREVHLDLEEGADIIMVKPALAYLDIVSRVKEKFNVPVAAFSVSAEYAMVKAAAQKDWIEEEKIVEEILLSIKRAGVDFILTYFAKDFARSKKV